MAADRGHLVDTDSRIANDSESRFGKDIGDLPVDRTQAVDFIDARLGQAQDGLA